MRISHAFFYASPTVAAVDVQGALDSLELEAMQRRRQLESLAAEGGRTFEERRRELEQWLARMENRLDRQPLVGQTLDVLETQLREHRVSERTDEE